MPLGTEGLMVIPTWAWIGTLIAVAAVMLFIGAGVGYWSSQKDQERLWSNERARSWGQGYQAGTEDQVRFFNSSRPQRPTENPYVLRAPFVRKPARLKAPEA